MTMPEAMTLVLEFAKALVWPVFITVMIIVYRKPVRAVLQNLIDKFSQASKVTIGSLSLEIQQRVRQAGNPQLARAVGELSPGAIAELLRTPRGGRMILVSTREEKGAMDLGLPSTEHLAVLQELESQGLLRFSPKSLKDFQRFVRSFPAKPSRTPNEGRPYWIKASSITGKKAKEIEEEGYEFTKEGRESADAVIVAVASLVRAP